MIQPPSFKSIINLKTLTIEQMSDILMVKPNTMRSKKWQMKTGVPLKKVGKRCFSLESEFNDWLADQHKMKI